MVGISICPSCLVHVYAAGACRAVTSMACRCRPQLGLLSTFAASSYIGTAALKASTANTAKEARHGFVSPKGSGRLHRRLHEDSTPCNSSTISKEPPRTPPEHPTTVLRSKIVLHLHFEFLARKPFPCERCDRRHRCWAR